MSHVLFLIACTAASSIYSQCFANVYNFKLHKNVTAFSGLHLHGGTIISEHFVCKKFSGFIPTYTLKGKSNFNVVTITERLKIVLICLIIVS